MERYEIEIKLPIRSIKEVEKQLIFLGFKKEKWMEETDTYFNSPFYDFAQKGEALRIRRKKDLETGNQVDEITYKGPKMDSVSMSRQELECKIEQGDVFEAIMDIIGMNEKYVVKKQRIYLRDQEITACLDRVEGLGDFLELEKIAYTKAEHVHILEVMKKIVEQLGYSMEHTTTVSYLSQLMKR